MSLWTRIRNVGRADRMNHEIDEELEAHVQDAVESGRDLGEARRALGAALKQREASRDIKLLPWLDSLRADAIRLPTADKIASNNGRGRSLACAGDPCLYGRFPLDRRGSIAATAGRKSA
jgi:hypothetical protein